eukprot:2426658-Alexandrium_andersonii.AAC.1
MCGAWDMSLQPPMDSRRVQFCSYPMGAIEGSAAVPGPSHALTRGCQPSVGEASHRAENG